MTDTNPLTAHLGYWLRFVSNHVSHAFARKVEGLGVTVAEWVVLRELYEAEAVAPSELAARLDLTRGAVSKLAERLLTKDLIIRAFSNDDRRFQSLTITEAGRALVPQLATLADLNDAEFFDRLPPEDRDHLRRILTELVRLNHLKTIPTD